MPASTRRARASASASGSSPRSSGRLRTQHVARIGRALIRIAVLLLTTALMLVVAEYMARFAFRNAHSSGNAGDYIAGRGGAPEVVNNALGFRDREIPPKSPDRYRIAVVGDSFAWGQGIAANERFSNLV